MKTHDYINFIENCYHEILVKNYIKQLINTDDCRVYEFRDKFIALVKKGEDITQGFSSERWLSSPSSFQV